MCAQEHQLVLHPASLVLGAKQAVGFGNLLRPKPLFVADGKCHTAWEKKIMLRSPADLPPCSKSGQAFNSCIRANEHHLEDRLAWCAIECPTNWWRVMKNEEEDSVAKPRETNTHVRDLKRFQLYLNGKQVSEPRGRWQCRCRWQFRHCEHHLRTFPTWMVNLVILLIIHLQVEQLQNQWE